MTKKINKPEVAILNGVFVTVASQILNSLLRNKDAVASRFSVPAINEIDNRVRFAEKMTFGQFSLVNCWPRVKLWTLTLVAFRVLFIRKAQKNL